MARQANQKLKLLYLLEILRRETDEEHPLTLKQIQDLLEQKGITAERKSLYDDMEQLRLFGEDVLSVRDTTVRYYIGERTLDMTQLRLLVDADLLEMEDIGCHPCVNTASIRLSMEDLLQRLLPAVHHEFTIVKLSLED